MKKYIIMAVSFIFTIQLYCNSFVREGSMETHSFLSTKDDITVQLNFDADSKEVFLSFHNNQCYTQYVPKFCVDLFQLNEHGLCAIVNGEISIKDSDDNYLDYLVKRIDIDIKNISINDCYEIKSKNSFETKRIKLDKIIEINKLKGKKIKFQYNGRFGKSNLLLITI